MSLIQGIGVTTPGGSHAAGGGNCQGTLFPTLQSGKISQLWIHIGGASSNIKVAIYANNAGAVGTRLWVNNTGQYCVSGWNVFIVSPAVDIVLGTSYWLCHNAQTGSSYSYDSTGTAKYLICDYASVGCPVDMSGASADTRTLSLQGWCNKGGLFIIIY